MDPYPFLLKTTQADMEMMFPLGLPDDSLKAHFIHDFYWSDSYKSSNKFAIIFDIW